MKKTISSALMIMLFSVCFAQTKPATPAKPANAKPAAAPAKAAAPVAASPANAGDDAFCKKWKYTGTEEFGVEAPPADNQKGDLLNLTCDKKAVYIKDGETKNGTWSVDKGKTNIMLVVNGTGEKIRLRIMKSEGKKIILEWQSPDLIRHRMNFEAN